MQFSFSYNNKPFLKVELEIGNELLAIIGPNGAGKTTLLKLLAGLLSGTKAKKDVAYLAQSEVLPIDFTVYEVVSLGRLPHNKFGLNKKDKEAIDTALKSTKTEGLHNRLIGSLSGGERQRVALARALAQEPKILLLDEPTNHLDLSHQLELYRLLKKEVVNGLSVVIVIHDLNLALQSDRCLLLDKGEIAFDGPPSEGLIRRISQVYGLSLQKLEQDDRFYVLPMW